MKLTTKERMGAFNSGESYLLVQNERVKVDNGILPLIQGMKWHIVTIRGKKYVKHSYRVGDKVKTLYLHEFISGYPVVGWKNGDTLDCTLDNMYNKSKKPIQIPKGD